MTRPTEPAAVRIASSVGGGPMERLAAALRAAGQDADVVAALSLDRWRELLSRGRAGRLWARLATYGGFPLQVLAESLSGGAAVLVPTTNPFFLPWLAVATRPLHGRPVVALLYDLYPDALEVAGLTAAGSVPSRLAAGLNRWCLARADGVVFIGRRMAEHVRARYGEPRHWTIIETGAAVAEFEALAAGPPESELERWCEPRFVVSYVGAMGHMHDWETLAAAGRLLAADPPAGERPLGLVVAASGPGVDRLRQAWADLPGELVRFEAPLPDRPWARLLARSHGCVATLRDAARKTSMPSKALSALAAGAALVAVAPADSDLGELLATHDVGLRVDPGDAAGLAAGLRALAADPARAAALRRRARETARDHYDMPRLAARWLDFLEALAPASQAAAAPGR